MSEITDKTSDAFLEGVALGAQMLIEGEAIRDCPSDDAGIENEPRDGRAQNLFVVPYLMKVSARPELMQGFAAVLSDKLGTHGMYAHCYAELEPSEIWPTTAA